MTGIDWLTHRPCSICPHEPPGTPVLQAPIRIKPRGRPGVTARYLEDLRQRISAAAGDDHQDLFDRELCIAMTFVLPIHQSRVLDVDNLAKTMCDGLRGTVYRDDVQIRHLDVVKVRIDDGAEEWVHLRVRPSRLAETPINYTM